MEFIQDNKATKKLVLQVVSRLFDPLGFLGPITVTVRILFQDLWEQGLTWEEELPSSVQQRWSRWCRDFPRIRDVRVERWFGSVTKCHAQLHIFCDASERAYGAVVYIRLTTLEKTDARTGLVVSKYRVAPLKRVALPRLELLGSLIGVRLHRYVVQALRWEHMASVFWTDSMITLCWIRKRPSNWKPFVANRVEEIHKLSDPASWRFCPGKENPADYVTRGITAESLKHNLHWWRGPMWLKGDEDSWPVLPITDKQSQHEAKREERKQVETSTTLTIGSETVLNLNRFHSLQKVLRIMAYVLRFGLRPLKQGTPTAEELSRALNIGIKLAQREAFGSEVAALIKKSKIDDKSPIQRFSPFLDQEGLLRVRGRLGKSSLTEELKFPILLPASHRMAELLVIHAHNRLMHSGVQLTMTEIREKYWILRCRQLTKRIIRQCAICRYARCKPGQCAEAPLPFDRITEAPPFQVVGVDFAGPLFVRIGAKDQSKAYIALFTCAVTRAVHLEAVSGLSADCFLLALKRFFARRGLCKTVYSDNAKTFKKTDLELRKIWGMIDHPEVKALYAHNGISWKFIIERAAWWGGFWERMVRSVKECLKKVLRNACLRFEELATILTEIEAILNSRPITHVSTELDEEEPLTPAHFLVGRRLTSLPHVKGNPVPQNVSGEALSQKWRYRNRLLNHFWTRWRKEYLLNLQSAHEVKMPTKETPFNVGDMVLIQEERLLKHRWRVGRIQEIYLGRDGRIRSCALRINHGQVLRRAIQHLYPLEI